MEQKDKKNIVLRLFIFISFITNFSLQAAVVKLNTGEEISGIILERTGKCIQIRVNGEDKEYMIEDIQDIKGRKPVFFQSRELWTGNTAQMFKEGLRVASKGFFLDAQDIFNKLLKIDPTNSNAKSALSIIEGVRVARVSEEYVSNLFKGAYYYMEGEYQKSIDAYERVLEISSKSIDIYYNLGNAYQSLGEADKSIKCYKNLIKHKPDDSSAIYQLGVSYYYLGNYAESIKYLEKLEELFADNPDYLSLIGMANYSAGNYIKGKNLINKAISLYIDDGKNFKAKEVNYLLEEKEIERLLENFH
ncbi:MAG: tetratricopeptide repeat protein [Candidatus Omnitrophica bacterium]|nr:tetratricopeptide repeat protein [Candidatus Omnitrophota bacterium]MCK5493708.1 tetratricopeptide repeat protein [Candidatus Omnitrophota bacterium]